MVAVNSIRTFDRHLYDHCICLRFSYLADFLWNAFKIFGNTGLLYSYTVNGLNETQKFNFQIINFSKNPCKESRYLRVFQLLWSETGNNSSGYWYCLIRMWIIMLIYIDFLCKGWKFSTIIWARKHECFWTVAFSFIFLAA